MFQERGLFSANGIRILSTPTPLQLETLPEDPRVEYFSSLGPNPVVIEDFNSKTAKPILAASLYFREYVIRPLSKKLREDLKGLGIVSVRGTACSLDGSIACPPSLPGRRPINKPDTIRTVDQILIDGTDTGDRKTKFGPFDLEREEVLQNYPEWGAILHPRDLRLYLGENGLNEEGIFPLLIVYDPRYEGSGWATIELPEAVEERSKAILKVYVLDFPHY